MKTPTETLASKLGLTTDGIRKILRSGLIPNVEKEGRQWSFDVDAAFEILKNRPERRGRPRKEKKGEKP